MPFVVVIGLVAADALAVIAIAAVGRVNPGALV
jgi:hypothetical protein